MTDTSYRAIQQRRMRETASRLRRHADARAREAKRQMAELRMHQKSLQWRRQLDARCDAEIAVARARAAALGVEWWEMRDLGARRNAGVKR